MTCGTCRQGLTDQYDPNIDYMVSATLHILGSTVLLGGLAREQESKDQVKNTLNRLEKFISERVMIRLTEGSVGDIYNTAHTISSHLSEDAWMDFKKESPEIHKRLSAHLDTMNDYLRQGRL